MYVLNGKKNVVRDIGHTICIIGLSYRVGQNLSVTVARVGSGKIDDCTPYVYTVHRLLKTQLPGIITDSI